MRGGRVRRALVVALATLVALTVAAGIVSADPQQPDRKTAGEICDEQPDTLVLAFPTGENSDSVTVYEGTNADLILCVDGAAESVENDWLPDDDRIVQTGDEPSAVASRSKEFVYTVRFVHDADSATDGPLSVPEREGIGDVDVTVAAADVTDIEKIETRQAEEFSTAVTAVDEAATTLATTTESLNEDGELSVDQLETAHQQLEQLGDSREALDSNATNLSGAIASEGEIERGVTISQLRAIEEERQRASRDAEGAVASYQETITAERSAIQSTLRRTVGGAALGGIFLGSILGAVVPWFAARRVRESMRFSRNVDYGTKIVLIPVGAGVLVGIIGLVLLGTSAGGAFFGVIL